MTGPRPPETRAQSLESGIAKRLLAQQRQRVELLGPNLAVEPVWTILLHLFIHYEQGERAAVLKFCTEPGTVPEVALRWLFTLAAEGKILWKSKAKDPYQARVELVPEMADQLRELLRSWSAERA